MTDLHRIAVRPVHHDVEVLETEDIWAKFGPKLPESGSVARGRSSFVYQNRRMGISVSGALLTIFLHALLFSPFLLGTQGRKPQPPLTEGAAASATNEQATEFISTLMILSNPSISIPQEQADSAFDVVIQAVEKNLNEMPPVAELAQISQPEVLGSEASATDDSRNVDALGDDAGRSAMYGIYMTQVKARIERAWEYPNQNSIDGFDCRVQIRQDNRGNVQEVTLQHCEDDPIWQMSLVRAIQHASPLSAPPNASVFSDLITLELSASTTAPERSKTSETGSLLE